MKLVALLVASLLFCSSLAEQSTTAPPHALFTPQNYHIAVTETFSLTSYGDEIFDATASVLYDDCKCTNGRRTCSNDFDNVYSQITRELRRGRPVMLPVEMPNIDELANRNYAVSVTSHNGTVNYLRRMQLFFPTDAFGFLLIRTDKPIYKPDQVVSYCLTFLDKTLKPHSAGVNVEIIIRDSKFKQIIKLDSVPVAAGDLKCLEFPLSEEPNFGTWRIEARLILPNEQGGCRPPYSLPRGSCSFKVEEFVLPRFEVTLTGPQQLERDDNTITGLVEAIYTFGEPLQGTVKINATLTASGRRESLVFYDSTHTLSNGRFQLNIPAEMYRQMVRYRYDPFCVKSTIAIVAEVEEAGRGTKAADTHRFSLVASPVDVKFADDNPKVFRPGLNYTVKAFANLADGSPALGTSVRMTVTINNGDGLLLDEEMTTNDEDGIITSTVPVPLDTNCMKISLRPSSQFTSCTEEFECFSPSPMYSPTKSFLQLTDVSRHLLRPNSRADIQVDSTVEFQLLHLLVISQGSVQHHTYTVERGGAKSTLVQFRITHSMTPKVKVLGFFAREDGELVADLIELEIRCDLENRMSLHFDQKDAKPGDDVSIISKAAPNSIVLLSVVDKSLTLLADACKSLDKDNVCTLLRQLTRGSLFGGQSCNSDINRGCCPLACSEPTLFGINNIFSAAGVTLFSNMFRPNPPFIRRPIQPPIFLPIDREIAFRPAPGAPGPVPTAVPIEDLGGNELPEPKGEEEARTFFPESWIFQLLKADSNGDAVLNSTTPDTITTWFAESIGLHSEVGLGVSRRAQLRVVKDFFVSLELPFSVNFGEAVTIIPLVFNFGRSQAFVDATIAVQVDDDLDIVENSLSGNNVLRIEQSSSQPFTLKLRPRAIGQLAITVAAVNNLGERDIVTKRLFVKPGCERFDLTENILAEGTGEHCFNYTLPSCVVPGSASATVSATGDIMSPPDINRLLVLPSGCGEQNLVKTATNWVVAEYLVATDQLQDFTAVKIMNNIQRGYQRQLNYLQGSGCYSIWPRGSCSLWLTAAVVNVFSGIVDFYRDQEPGMELIDISVINGGLNYVINNQDDESGVIPIIGRVHNFRLLNEEHSGGHTAFALVALKQYMDTFSGDAGATSTLAKARSAILLAESYLESIYNDEENVFCNYGLALISYSLFRSPNRELRLSQRLLADLRSRITISKQYAGACFVCDGCPNVEEERRSEEGPECASRPRSEGSAACVETTAYTLLALLEAEDTQFTVCLAQWLVRIRSGSGGFYSSQDTVIAMQALAAFGEISFTSEINKELIFNLPGLGAEAISITNENRFERTEKKIPSVPSNDNCITWSGAGTAIIQSTLSYHGCDCCDDTRSFSLELATVRRDTLIGTVLNVFIRIRYLAGDFSNMAIVDVEIPSGYIFLESKLLEDEGKQAELQRVDRRGSNAVFYFNNVPGRVTTTFLVEFQKRFEVDNPQQSPVTIYDYYDPGKIVTKYYLPVTSEPLSQATTPPPAKEPDQTLTRPPPPPPPPPGK